MVVSRDYIDVPVGDRAMRTFVSAPRGGGPHPGVVFYTDIFQLTESSLRWAVRLAGYGFLVAAPEIYHRIEPAGTVLGFDDEGKRRGQADAEATPVADFDADIRAALDHLEGRASALGAAGHCTGGHLAFRAAFDPRVRATACWYPTGLHDGALGADPDAGTLGSLAEIRGRLMLVFGSQDPHVPAGARLKIVSALYDAGLHDVELHVYAGGEHAFMRDVGPRHDPALTDLALASAVSFFTTL